YGGAHGDLTAQVVGQRGGQHHPFRVVRCALRYTAFEENAIVAQRLDRPVPPAPDHRRRLLGQVDGDEIAGTDSDAIQYLCPVDGIDGAAPLEPDDAAV